MPPVRIDICCLALEAEPPLVAAARTLLSADEMARADRFAFPRHGQAFTLSRAALRLLLAERTGVAANALTFEYGPEGKPSLTADMAGPWRFNVSDSGALLACAFAHGLDLGIDIEQHRPLRYREDLAERFFAPEECADLLAFPDDERARAFFDCWARKEAFIKADGRGMRIPLDSFRVSLEAAPGGSALLGCRDEEGPRHAWLLRPFDVAPGYSGALAIRAAAVDVAVRHTTTRDLFAGSGLL